MNRQKSVDFGMLFPPNMNYEYFEGFAAMPFSPGEKSCNLGNAWWLAESSLLSYEHPGFIKYVLRSVGAENYRFFTWETTQAIVYTIGRACVVAFRGTEVKSSNFFADALSDIHFNMVDFYGKGLVHKGFKLAFDEALNGDGGNGDTGLIAYAEGLVSGGKADSVYFTGHSLGGALATLSAAYFSKTADALYTFGAPRVGNGAFCANLPKLVYRFVNVGDPVPYLPPNLPGVTKDQSVFCHSGSLMYFDESKKLWPDASIAPENIGGLIGNNIKSVAFNMAKRALNILGGADRKSAGDVIRDSNMDAHAPVLYAIYIWNYLASRNMNPILDKV